MFKLTKLGANAHESGLVNSDMAAVTSLEVQLDKYFTGHSSWNKPEERDWWSQGI